LIVHRWQRSRYPAISRAVYHSEMKSSHNTPSLGKIHIKTYMHIQPSGNFHPIG
jgi:hypothetical protein